jgi:hypothetical protein
MKYLLILLGLLLIGINCFAANNTRTTAVLPTQATYSAATGSITGTCTKGLLRVSRSNLFVCSSTASSTYGRWKKTAVTF